MVPESKAEPARNAIILICKRSDSDGDAESQGAPERTVRESDEESTRKHRREEIEQEEYKTVRSVLKSHA